MVSKLLRRFYSFTLLIALVISPFAATFSVRVSNAQSPDFSDVAGDEYHRMKVVLHVDHAPEIGGVATLTFSVTPLLKAPDLTVTWQLPDGGE